MPYDVENITSDIAEAMLAWCGVTSPTPADLAVAEVAASAAQDAIKHYRGLGADDDFEPEYKSLAIEMAVYLYSKRGADGVIAFSENGIQRSYEKGTFPPSMLARIKLPLTAG